MPYRIGFPILVANAIQIALQQAELSEVRAQPTGLLPKKKYKEESEYRITGPGGSSHSGTTNADGLLTGIPAPQVGRYTIAEGSKQVDSIGVSLLSADETNLASVEKIQFKELSVAAAGEKIDSDWPLWSYIAAAALCLLLLEWWYFQRRPGGVPA
jgi:Ca-activated chloride channel family protein